ncbi:TPA: hypothetical protein N0F65_000212, partial [Lagenidium giganteum]
AIAKLVGRSPTAVRNYIRDNDGYGTRKSGGRPPKVTPTAVRRLVRAASQTGQSSTKLQRDLELPIKTRRVRQILSGSKPLKYQTRKGQPRLSKEHCKKRIKFATTNVDLGAKWVDVIFSDEKIQPRWPRRVQILLA